MYITDVHDGDGGIYQGDMNFQNDDEDEDNDNNDDDEVEIIMMRIMMRMEK